MREGGGGGKEDFCLQEGGQKSDLVLNLVLTDIRGSNITQLKFPREKIMALFCILLNIK